MSGEEPRAPSTAQTRNVRALGGRLRARLAEKSRLSAQPLGPAALTPEQLAFWAQEKAAGPSAALTSLRAWRLRGPLSRKAITAAMGALIDRQDALRMRLRTVDGAPQPAFDPPGSAAWASRILPVMDVSDRAPTELDHETDAALRNLSHHRFELAGGPLAAMRLLRVGAQEHVVIVALHHIIADDWSFDVLARDLGALYEEALGRGDGPPPLQLSFESHLRRRAAAETPEPPDAPATSPSLSWPSPPERAEAADEARARIVAAQLGSDSAAALTAAAAAQSITPFAILAAGFQTVLGRCCAQDDLSIGVAFADRKDPAQEALIGLFIRQGAVSAALDAGTTVHELAARAHAQLLQMREAPTVGGSAANALIVFYNAPVEGFEATDLVAEPISPVERPSPVDLHLAIRPQADGGLTLELIGRRAVFSPAELEALLAAYRRLLAAALRSPDLPIGDVDLVGDDAPAAAAQAIAEAPFDAESDIAAQFERAARRWPDQIALESPTRAWRYAELDALGDRVAAWLAATGASPGDAVGVLAGRGAWLVALHLGAQKAGLTVAPLDPDYPEARLRMMLETAEAVAVLTPPDAAPPDLGRPVWQAPGFDALPPPSPSARPIRDPRGPAYLFFTSGSTGRPKAVLATHLGVARYMSGLPQPPLGPGDRLMLITSPSFDPTLLEIWGALLHGAALVAPDWDAPTPSALGRSLRASRISAGCMTTGLFNLLVDADPAALASFRWLMVGGEAMSAAHARAALAAAPRLKLWNVYGPTENAMYSTAYEVAPEITGRVPIGRPMANNHAFVLGPDLRPAPIGFSGEIYVGGAGLALGYKGAAPEKQAAFTEIAADRLGLGAGRAVRLYRTGDRGLRTETGAIAFLGRVDKQFKLNGVRIEPGDVERAVAEHPAVSRAVVEPVWDEESARAVGLIAYVETAEADLDPAELRRHAADRLPRALTPTRWVRLAAFPLTANGKIDRAALAATIDAPPQGRDAGRSAEQSGGGRVDPTLSKLWRKILDAPTARPEDDFFDCGGGSLGALKLIAQVERRFSVEVDVTGFFRNPRLETLQAALRSRASAPRNALLRRLQTGAADGEPVVFLPGGGGASNWAANMAAAWATTRPLFGASLRPLERELAKAKDLEALADRLIDAVYEEVGGRAPHLVGYSYAGFLAFFVAARAKRRGLPVGRVVMFDSATNFDRLSEETLLAARASSPAELTLRRHMRLLKARTRLEPASIAVDAFQCPMAPRAIRWNSSADWVGLAEGGVSLLPMPCYHNQITRGDHARDAAERTEALLQGRIVGRRLGRRPLAEGVRALADKGRAVLLGGDATASARLFEWALHTQLDAQAYAPVWLLHTALYDAEPEVLRGVRGRLAADDPMNAPALMWLATAFSRRRSASAAGALAAQATALDAASGLASAVAVFMLLRSGKVELAVRLASDLEAASPESLDARLASALCAGHLGRRSTAGEMLGDIERDASEQGLPDLARFAAAQSACLAKKGRLKRY
ncbi:MAG: amino acid adenylation domain-containing protein [Pseudomonadota bacterium]